MLILQEGGVDTPRRVHARAPAAYRLNLRGLSAAALCGQSLAVLLSAAGHHTCTPT
jgi:hypothetical protein